MDFFKKNPLPALGADNGFYILYNNIIKPLLSPFLAAG
jgi:hypothetical protein